MFLLGLLCVLSPILVVVGPIIVGELILRSGKKK